MQHLSELLLNLFEVSANYRYDECVYYEYCTHIVHTLYKHCTHIVHTLYKHCTHIVHTLYKHCTHITHQVEINFYIISDITFIIVIF